MKKVLLIETLSLINGGQKMSLLVSDMLRSSGGYEVIWAIPEEGILSQRLKEKCYQYFLLGDMTLPSGVKAKSIAFRYGTMSVRVITGILRIIRKEKIDIIYAPGPAALPWSAVCGSMSRKPVIWHLHHNFEDGPTKKLINYCCRFGSVKRVIAVSETVGKQISDPDKAVVLYNPIDFLKYSTGDKTKVQSEFPFCTGKSIVVHVALLEEEKRQKITIQTVAELKKNDIEVFAAFVGTVKPGEDEYLKQLKHMAEELEVSDRCCFLGYRTDVQDILDAADVAFIPSIEGFPLAGLEACAAGVPIVACNKAGAGELVDKALCGSTFLYNDASDAAEKVAVCLSSANEYRISAMLFSKSCEEKKYRERIIECFSLGETV